MLANLRLVLEVEVQAGNQHAAKHSAPGLWTPRWYRILSHALVKYLKGRQLDPPRRLQAA
jgi:hypothetical protein